METKYLTTFDLARELGMYPQSVQRWVRQWLPHLPKPDDDKKPTYRIPEVYRLVARAWQQCEVPKVRRVVARTLVADPNPYVVVCGDYGATFDGTVEASEGARKVLNPLFHLPVYIFYVGSVDETW